ncbi:aspartyl/asparaginyl beta-hydroxylase isoform X2 [Lutzomyia longipalpis]|uniref:aspartyl/asparaginyl beta-hydroxylase isoform X2 n=1 Tax=Lutzomyia longipalpis TaxID=7200 RepID=UPI0024841CCB|nr:aspartyl/asparaginyl beta-hydroxylase isoform X2 [Lutzomyia longipalpis]
MSEKPRKRKDKKKKDSVSDAAELARKLSTKDAGESTTPHPSGVQTMGPDDVQLHVHKDHGTGGHWCAKIVFFSLLAILAGLVGLIILENRGLSDVDTPLSESRFSDILEGWVEENRESHDDHEHDILASMEELEEHDEHGEPFEEEDDHDEEHDGEDDDEDHDHEDDDEDHDQEDDEENDGEEDDEDEQQVDADEDDNEAQDQEDDDDDQENNDDDQENDNEDEENDDEQDQDDDEDQNIDDGASEEIQNDAAYEEDEDDDEAADDDDNNNDDDEDDAKNNDDDDNDDDAKNEDDDDNDNNGDDNDDNDNEDDNDDNDNQPDIDDDDNSPFEEPFTLNKSNPVPLTKTNDTPKTDKVTIADLEVQIEEMKIIFDEVSQKLGKPSFSELRDASQECPADSIPINDCKLDDDGSFEEVIDNDAGEDLHLQKLAQKDSPEPDDDDDLPASPSSSLAEKILIGLALIVVAHSVLLRKTFNKGKATEEAQEVVEEIVEQSAEDLMTEDGFIDMRRRLTIGTDEEPLLDPEDDIEYDEDEEDVEDLGEEEDEDEEAPEDIEEYEDEDEVEMPATFEELNAMYRPKVVETKAPEPKTVEQKVGVSFKIPESRISEPKIPERRISEPKVSETRLLEPKVPERRISEPRISETRIYDPKVQESRISEPKVSELKIAEPKVSGPSVQIPKEPPKRSEPEKLPEPSEEYEIDEEDIDQDDVEYEEEEYEGSDYEAEEGSDIDDSDLMKRLEEKYGKLPHYSDKEDDDEDKTWTKIPPRSGAQSLRDDLQSAHDALEDNPRSALNTFERILKIAPQTPEALYGRAKALDRLSELQQSNAILRDAIEAYEAVLKLKTNIGDDLFTKVALRCINRIRFLGLHTRAIPIHEALIRRFDDEPEYRNELAITHLFLNQLSEAKYVLHHTLLRWRDNPVALVHYGFVLKNLDQDYEGASIYLSEGIASNADGTQDGRFYFALGDSLLRLGRHEEARKVFRNGVERKLFLSEYQRSLYNVDTLKSKPFWTIDETKNRKLFETLERNWELIRDEGMKLLNQKGFFMDEAENLKDKGDWKQFDLFVKGQRITKHCQKAPITCNIMESFPAARFCTRGQIKFSVMHPGTHIWPHCGPTNCRIRAHLGLHVPPGTFIRVAEETKSWREGKMLIFDDSFEHEVWHNGTDVRLVLIVDIWHPDLTEAQRKSLQPI